MKFRVQEGIPLKGVLKYVEESYAFEFTADDVTELNTRNGGGRGASLSLNELQLETAVATGEVIYPWGYCPKIGWKSMALAAPISQPARIFVGADEELMAYTGYSVTDSRWTVGFDESTGWVRIFNSDSDDRDLIGIAVDTVIGLNGDSLSSVWMHPTIVSK